MLMDFNVILIYIFFIDKIFNTMIITKHVIEVKNNTYNEIKISIITLCSIKINATQTPCVCSIDWNFSVLIYSSWKKRLILYL